MGHKYSSLAIDESFKELESEHSHDATFEPELKVFVNVHYRKPLQTSTIAESHDIVQVSGRITISF